MQAAFITSAPQAVRLAGYNPEEACEPLSDGYRGPALEEEVGDVSLSLSLSLSDLRRKLVLGLRRKLVLGLVASMATFCCAQTPTQLVIHLYVDPIYGDDPSVSGTGVNSFFNPDGLGPECTGASHPIVAPNSVQDSSAGTPGPGLLHAAYPFKTITKAIAYVNRLSTGGNPPLPFADPSTGLVWSHCIIHLLPGWYGRDDSTMNNFSLSAASGTHFGSRLIPNGEKFPLHVPPRVSLAGTSILNTFIDTGQVGTAIEFGVVDTNGVPISGDQTFIDKVTFFACGGRVATPVGSTAFESNGRHCCAILLDDQVSSHPTISNCVFLKNAIGVLVNAAPDDPVTHGIPGAISDVQHDGTKILNCTFAWNVIGLWNGQIDDPISSIGLSKLILVNNVFDGTETIDVFAQLPCNTPGPVAANAAWPQFPLIITANGISSAFEGVCHQDLEVMISVGGTPTARDFNAYERDTVSLPAVDNYNNRGGTAGIAAALPLTSPRSPGGPTTPGINIASITGFNRSQQNVRRGVLFVTDLVCRGSTVGAFPAFGPVGARTGFDLSTHDLRLSPIEVPAAQGLTDSNGDPVAPALNRLVDAGWSGPFPAVMANGFALTAPPGTLPLNASSQPGWLHHCWEADGEGYGNPRIHDHPAYANTGVPLAGTDAGIDIGADEVGEVIVAGYRFGHSGFLRLAASSPDNPSPLPPVDNSTLFYLGPPTALGLPAIPVPQPDYRTINDLGPIDFAWSTNYPPGYQTNGMLRTWSSAEAPMPALTTSTVSLNTARPYFGIRETLRRTLTITPPASFPSSGNPIVDLVEAVQNVGASYGATAADITPVLLPDLHPWWTEVIPSTLAPIDFATMCPTLPIWQDLSVCVGDNYLFQRSTIGVYNAQLYQTPLAPDMSPPGARTGGGSGAYAWLDDTSILRPTGVAPFENWSNSPLLIHDYDAWCRGGNSVPPVPLGSPPHVISGRGVFLPHTEVVVVPNPQVTEAAELRFTLEWNAANIPWQLPAGTTRQKNMQSFTIVLRLEFQLP